MKKCYHISYASRSKGDQGGVSKFAHYLQKTVFPQMTIYSWEDHPEWQKLEHLNMFHKVIEFNHYLLQNHLLDDARFIAVDGLWSVGLPIDLPVINICHGTWLGYGLSTNNSMHKELGIIQYSELYDRKNIVAVSDFVQLELKELLSLDSTVINNAVDEQEFYPGPQKGIVGKPRFIHVAQPDQNKGYSVLKQIQAIMPEVDFCFLNAQKNQEAEKFRQGDFFIHLSNYEGNSYAILEALCCDLPCLVTNVGLTFNAPWFHDCGLILDQQQLSHDLIKVNISKLINERHRFHPRQALLKYLNLERFKREWLAYVDKFFPENF